MNQGLPGSQLACPPPPDGAPPGKLLRLAQRAAAAPTDPNNGSGVIDMPALVEELRALGRAANGPPPGDEITLVPVAHNIVSGLPDDEPQRDDETPPDPPVAVPWRRAGRTLASFSL